MTIYSVSDVTKFIQNLFDRETEFHHILLRGEISNFKRYSSGHCYFTLKDENSCIKCVMFRGNAQYLKFQPQDGMLAVADGRISVYERDGVYQLYVNQIVPEGIGALALAFEQLKARLEKEGLFDSSKKKPLPFFPKRIGIVTSSSGAVLRDIFKVAKRRNPHVQLILYPSQVQGDGAAEQIARGIRFFNKKYPVDVLIIGRGGGSAEDLWSFNEEIVVRAIASSVIPVVSAVGHETDYTLSDFASDVRAATPSHAAELIVPDVRELISSVEGLRIRMRTASQRILQRKRLLLEKLQQNRAFLHPNCLLDTKRQELDYLFQKVLRLTDQGLKEKRTFFETQMGKLDLLNPARVLYRGYSIVEHQGKIVHSVRNMKVGDRLELHFTDGDLRAVIDSIGKEDVWGCQEKKSLPLRRT